MPVEDRLPKPRSRGSLQRLLRRVRDVELAPSAPPLRSGVEPTFASRFECKYFVSPRVLGDIRAYIQPFVEPDAFAAVRPAHRYPVCSLYLDSPDLALYRQVINGEHDRYKLRVRTYTDEPDAPAYVEVKQKLNNTVHKRRAGLPREQAARLLSQQGGLDWIEALSNDRRRDTEYFRERMLLSGARPVVRVKYMREAYQSTGNEPARITIDTDLVHAMTLDEDLRHEAGCWIQTPTRGAILEIKFTDRFPWWIQDLVRVFGLKQQAVPKYILCIDRMLDGERNSTLSLAGTLLPPRRI